MCVFLEPLYPSLCPRALAHSSHPSFWPTRVINKSPTEPRRLRAQSMSSMPSWDSASDTKRHDHMLQTPPFRVGLCHAECARPHRTRTLSTAFACTNLHESILIDPFLQSLVVDGREHVIDALIELTIRHILESLCVPALGRELGTALGNPGRNLGTGQGLELGTVLDTGHGRLEARVVGRSGGVRQSDRTPEGAYTLQNSSREMSPPPSLSIEAKPAGSKESPKTCGRSNTCGDAEG